MKRLIFLFELAAVALLVACAGTEGNSAYDRAQGRETYESDLRIMQNRSSMLNTGGVTPLMGVGAGSGSNGMQPFSNPGALYSIPQSH